MKKLLLSLALLSTSAIAKDLVVFVEGTCRSTDEIHRAISSYEEVPMMSGKGIMTILDRNGNTHEVGHTLKLYLNSTTLAYTIITEFPEDDVSCVIMVGDELQPFRGKPQV